jgi:hypothetical protein
MRCNLEDVKNFCLKKNQFLSNFALLIYQFSRPYPTKTDLNQIKFFFSKKRIRDFS